MIVDVPAGPGVDNDVLGLTEQAVLGDWPCGRDLEVGAGHVGGEGSLEHGIELGGTGWKFTQARAEFDAGGEGDDDHVVAGSATDEVDSIFNIASIPEAEEGGLKVAGGSLG